MKFKFVCAAVIILLLTACGGTSQELVVGIMPDLDSIPFVVAVQQGYMPENIRLDLYQSPVDRDSALYSGNLDGTISDVLAVCIARQGGYDAYITSMTNGRYALLSASPVNDISELYGKRLGLSLNTIIEYSADCIIAGSGGDPSRVLMESVPKIPSRLELLNNGQLDAIAVPEPYAAAAVQGGAYVVDTSERLGINPGVMLFMKPALEGKRQEIKALYEAYDKAVEYISKTDKSEFMPAVIEELGMPESALSVELPVYSKASMPSEDEVSRARQWLSGKGIVKTEYSYKELIFEIK